MGVFEMIVLVVFIAAAGEVLKTAVAGRKNSAAEVESGRIAELEAHLQANETRLLDAEERVNELGEKVEFLENLLARPDAPGQLPGRRDRGGSEAV